MVRLGVDFFRCSREMGLQGVDGTHLARARDPPLRRCDRHRSTWAGTLHCEAADGRGRRAEGDLDVAVKDTPLALLNSAISRPAA
jgi:hypothetical protein